jgi:hypothetical protein
VLLRAGVRPVVFGAAGVAVVTGLAAGMVAVYAGTSLPVAGFGSGFNFGVPGMLTQDWTAASVPEATAVTLELLVSWVVTALVVRRWRVPWAAGAGTCVLGAAVAAVSLVATAQMTVHVSRAGTAAAQAVALGPGVRPGDRVAVASSVPWQLWVPQAFGVPWARLELFDPLRQGPPAGVTVVEVPWPAGQPAQASWPDAPAGWHVVASSRSGGWVTWRS